LPEPPARPAPSSQARASGDGRAAESKDSRLSAERNLLEISRTALGRGKIDWALAALRRHARLYPNGQLAEERDGLMVQALVGKGDYAQARERATRFHRQHPHSLFAPAVDQALQSIP
jgi:TolA-binding protein